MTEAGIRTSMPENSNMRKLRISHAWRELKRSHVLSCSFSKQSSGFSLIELLVVVSVMLIVAAFAIPTLSTTLDSFRVRGTVSSAANLIQRARTQAIKVNQSQRIHFATVASRVTVFVTNSNDAAVAPVRTDKQLSSQIEFPYQFSIGALPAGGPTLLTGNLMWGSTLTPKVNVDPYFNSRGLPCLPDPVTQVCAPTTGFVYYYKYTTGRSARWAATSISPAGRIESWYWNGTAWGN